MKKLLFINVVGLLLWLSCAHPTGTKNDTGDAYLAKVGRYTLSNDEVKQVLPHGLDSLDSVAFVNNFIHQWVRQKLLLAKAETLLSLNEKEMSRKMEEYRENLLIYRLEQKYIQEELDTLISEELSSSYYKEHIEKFKLSSPIVQAVIVKVPTYASEPEEIKRLLMSKDTNDFLSLESYCFRYATRYDDFNNEWVPFNVIERFFKDDFQQPKKFFQKSRYYEQLDSLNFRCVYLKKFMNTGEYAPYEYAKKRVNNWILNERKQKLLRDLDSLTYLKAVEQEHFIIKGN